MLTHIFLYQCTNIIWLLSCTKLSTSKNKLKQNIVIFCVSSCDRRKLITKRRRHGSCSIAACNPNMSKRSDKIIFNIQITSGFSRFPGRERDNPIDAVMGTVQTLIFKAYELLPGRESISALRCDCASLQYQGCCPVDCLFCPLLHNNVTSVTSIA